MKLGRVNPAPLLLVFSLAAGVVGPLPCRGDGFDRVRFALSDAPPAGSAHEWPRVWGLGHDVTFQLRGRIDTDAIWATQSAANEADFGELEDVVGLRRARIGAEGALGPESRYVAEIDLASGGVVPRDIYAAFGSRPDGESQWGHFREPFSLEGGTSARYFAFMERSPINVLDPARSWGAGWFREDVDAQTSAAIGLFHDGTGPAGLQGSDGAAVGLTARLTAAPVNEGDGERLLHFGLALSERVPEDGVIVINQQPRSPLLELSDSSTTPFVPEIRIPADFQQLVNLQVAAARGPVWTQSEWYGTFIDQSGGPVVFLHGFHVDYGCFLTGEHRAYDASNGTLGAVRVHRPWRSHGCDRDRPQGRGAWELTARFAYLNFSDAPPDPSGVQNGVDLFQSTFGTNWYLSDRVRLMFNYSYLVAEDLEVGASAASIYATRLGVFW